MEPKNVIVSPSCADMKGDLKCISRALQICSICAYIHCIYMPFMITVCVRIYIYIYIYIYNISHIMIHTAHEFAFISKQCLQMCEFDEIHNINSHG